MEEDDEEEAAIVDEDRRSIPSKTGMKEQA